LGFENSNLYSCIKDVMIFLGNDTLRGGKRLKGVVILSDDLLLDVSQIFWYNLAFSRGVVFYYHNDHLNTPVKMTDEKGNVVWEVVDKHPFGEFEVKGKTVNLSDYGGVESWSYTVENPLRFPGQYNDYNYRSVIISGKKGPYYNYHRWYNPDIGRYMEVDPIINMNKTMPFIKQYLEYIKCKSFLDIYTDLEHNSVYVYAENNTMRYFDPLGMMSRDDVIRCMRENTVCNIGCFSHNCTWKGAICTFCLVCCFQYGGSHPGCCPCMAKACGPTLDCKYDCEQKCDKITNECFKCLN